MKVYHGSFCPVEKPDTVHSRQNVDFGPGFYVTPLREQAEKWATRFRAKGKDAVLSIYELDDAFLADCKLRSFEAYSEEWLDYILQCRRGVPNTEHDIIMGGVANDKVFNTVELFFDGLIDKAEAIRRLRYEEPNMQICLRTQKCIAEYLHYEGSECLC